MGKAFSVEITSGRVKVSNTTSLVVFEDVVETVFVGQSPLNSITEFSGHHGPEWDGNSMLRQMNKFVLQRIRRLFPIFLLQETIGKRGCLKGSFYCRRLHRKIREV